MPKTKKVIIGLLIAVVSILAIFKMLSVLELFSLFIEQKPPQITEGEFPFVVEYEIDGRKLKDIIPEMKIIDRSF